MAKRNTDRAVPSIMILDDTRCVCLMFLRFFFGKYAILPSTTGRPPPVFLGAPSPSVFFFFFFFFFFFPPCEEAERNDEGSERGVRGRVPLRRLFTTDAARTRGKGSQVRACIVSPSDGNIDSIQQMGLTHMTRGRVLKTNTRSDLLRCLYLLGLAHEHRQGWDGRAARDAADLLTRGTGLDRAL